MTTGKITKRIVDDAEPRTVRYTIFDTEVRGFGLRIFPSGQKSWVFEYKGVEGGRKATTKRVTIGRVTEFTPDEARKLADRFRARVKVGQDPQSEKAKRREALKLSEVAEGFLSKHVEPRRKSGTHAHYKDVLDRIVLPKLGAKKAEDISSSDLAKLHLEWAHTPFQANRILSVGWIHS